MFIKLQEEEIPSFALHFSFQANMAFMVAVFVLASALGWALRDHRRRLLEIATEEQEDRLYLTVLGILFCVCTMGSYYAFNRPSSDMASGPSISRNILIDEIYRSLLELHGYWNRDKMTTNVPYSPDYPVKMPIPKRATLDEAMHSQHEPSQEYRSLTSLVLLFVLIFTVWYFYPRRRPDMSRPKSYIDETAYEDKREGGSPTSMSAFHSGSGLDESPRPPPPLSDKSAAAASSSPVQSKSGSKTGSGTAGTGTVAGTTTSPTSKTSKTAESTNRTRPINIRGRR